MGEKRVVEHMSVGMHPRIHRPPACLVSAFSELLFPVPKPIGLT